MTFDNHLSDLMAYDFSRYYKSPLRANIGHCSIYFDLYLNIFKYLENPS